MLKRVVKMQFQDQKINEFISIFNHAKPFILKIPGCIHVELLKDIKDPSVMFTLSHWESEEALNQYRNSELFVKTWAETKFLFKAKPEAWSLVQLDRVKNENLLH